MSEYKSYIPKKYSSFKETWLPIIITLVFLFGTGMFLFANTNGWIDFYKDRQIIQQSSILEYVIVMSAGECWVVEKGQYSKNEKKWTAVYHSKNYGKCFMKVRDLYLEQGISVNNVR